jgi:hypothetical protein
MPAYAREVTLPDESDAERAANRRSNRHGVIVAGGGLLIVLVVGVAINFGSAIAQLFAAGH